MSKRKHSKSCEEDLEHLMQKMKKLERKIQRRSKSSSSTDSSLQTCTTLSYDTEAAVTTALGPDELPKDPCYQLMDELEEPNCEQIMTEVEVIDQSLNEIPLRELSNSTTEPQCDDTPTIELDTEVLEILGEDPSCLVKYSADINKELASRLQHVATEGLNKDHRKELMSKYLIPANCLLIESPKINLEIKAAIPEAILKRDRGIELKQKQMASAISCLASTISTQLGAKEKNKELLQKLLDATRILCDIQHADSITRRNFILFTLKKEMKEHIINTKIDTFLFSEQLSETLKSAKAVQKSGVELKAEYVNKNAGAAKKKALVTPALNRRAPARKPPGPPPPPRNRLQAARAPLPPPAPSFRRSLQQPPPQPQRRRY